MNEKEEDFITPVNNRGVRVQIQKHCMDKMQGWCNTAESEVSGYGLVTLENGIFKVRDVFLPEQRCSSSYTLIESEALGRLLYSLHTRGKDAYDLWFWWHTHYNFGTFWSGTDEEQAQKIAIDNRRQSLTLVINQNGDRLCRADFKTPIDITINNLPIDIVPNVGKVSKRDYKWDVKRWVKPMYVEQPRTFHWSRKPIVLKTDHEPEYINYGGYYIPQHHMQQIINCPCGDGTCIDCKDTKSKVLELF